jgi:hypothetical protein
MVKKILVGILFLFSFSLKAQYGSSISYVPEEKTIIGQTFGINDIFGAYVGVNQDYIYNYNQTFKPYPLVSRFGLNMAIAKNGVNIGGGVKIKRDINTSEDSFLPHAIVSVHPFRLIRQKNTGVDFEFLLDISTDRTNYGFGILIPFWLNRF